LAQSPATGKLSVEVVGLLIGLGVSATKPASSAALRSGLPVTATALAGTPALTGQPRTSGPVPELKGAEQAGADPGIEDPGRRERDEVAARVEGTK